MSVEALNHYYSSLGLPSSIWQAYFDFGSSAGSTIPSQSGAPASHSGVMVGGTISVAGGRGNFNTSTHLRINNTGERIDDWTILCSFEKANLADGIIFSNFSSGIVNSGFVFGITAGNRVYVESFSEDGPVLYQSPTVLGKKNIVALTKAGQSLFIDYLNANSETVESAKFELPPKAFLHASNWMIGGQTGAPAYFSGANFSGYIDDFILLSEAIRPDEINGLFKGFYSDMVSGVPEVNSAYVYSLGMNRLTFLQDLDPTDTTDVFIAKDKHGVVTLNRDAVYDRTVGDFYADEDIQTTGVSAYVNGIAQIVSTGHTIGGTFYAPTYTLNGHFMPSGQRFFANASFDDNDRLVYDLTSTSFDANGFVEANFSHAGLASRTIPLYSFTDLVFFNGIKLVRGIDYTIASGSSVATFPSGNALYEGITGLLFTTPLHSDLTVVGSSNILNSGMSTFARNTSCLWLNGVRQNLGESYLEISDIDLLAGTGTFPTDPSNLFSSEETFLGTV